MRFGISATSLIVPKNFLTRLRPVNVCAIFSLSIRLRRAARAPLRTAAFYRDHRDRRRAVRFYAIRAWPGPLLFTVTADRGYGRLSCRDPPGSNPGISFHLVMVRLDRTIRDLIRLDPQIALFAPGISLK